jgi:hypothetical protein
MYYTLDILIDLLLFAQMVKGVIPLKKGNEEQTRNEK